MSEEKTYCGFIAIIGRVNVGKSTLLNNLLKQKISITSRKIQTTRQCILGVNTEGPYQAIYIDTPGLYMRNRHSLNYKERNLINDVELVIFVVNGTHWTPDDEIVLKKLYNSNKRVILAVNKIDNIQRKINLLPHLRWLNNQMNFLDIIPISAHTGLNVDIIKKIVHKNLPELMHNFPREYITNHSQYFMASEIIREKLIRFLGAELPYSATVEIKSFQSNKCGSYSINGVILVKRERQKKIVIGNKGSKIKTISIAARHDLQKMVENTVHLKLWVKVKSS